MPIRPYVMLQTSVLPQRESLRWSVAALAVAVALCVSPAAHAGTTTDIALPYSGGLYSNWSGAIDGASIAAAGTSGNQSTGITFANWSGQFDDIHSGATSTINGLNIQLGTTATVNTLFNTFYGNGATDATLTFTNSANQTDVVNLVGGDTIRDYYNNPVDFENNLSGSDPGVTAQVWWTDNTTRLDVQSILLPTSWAGTSLVSISVSNPANNGASSGSYVVEDVLSAAQVVTNGIPSGPIGVTPEPSSLILLGTGVVGAAGTLRRSLGRS